MVSSQSSRPTSTTDGGAALAAFLAAELVRSGSLEVRDSGERSGSVRRPSAPVASVRVLTCSHQGVGAQRSVIDLVRTSAWTAPRTRSSRLAPLDTDGDFAAPATPVHFWGPAPSGPARALDLARSRGRGDPRGHG